MRRLLTWAIVAVMVILITAAGFWAGRVAMVPPDDPLASAVEPVLYEVVEQTIGRTLRFTAVAEWEAHPLVTSWAAGVVTSIDFEPGAAIDRGLVLFSVNLRPVVVAEGAVPAFRDMKAGDMGPDVAQLQAMLLELGFAPDADGHFGTATVAAVRSWRAALGAVDDRVVHLGDIVFVPELPTRVVATDSLTVGASLGGGEVVVLGLSPAPRIVIPLAPEQRDLVPLTGDVAVTYPDGVWRGVVARAVESTEPGSGMLDLILEAANGGPLCGETCAEWIPPLDRTDFEAELVVVPETTGPVVPMAAILTDPGGAQTVRLADGTEVPVEVRASTGGLAVVSGVESGDVIVLPFTEPGG